MGTFRNRLWVRFDAMSWSGENQPTGEKVGFFDQKDRKVGSFANVLLRNY